MNADIEALLALQADDTVLDTLEARLVKLAPRARELDRVRTAAESRLEQARSAAEGDERRHAALGARVAEHRQLHARNVAQLETVRKMRDATAAESQVEQARHMLAAEEQELGTLSRRMAEMAAGVDAQEAALAALDEEQKVARDALAGERAGIDAEIATARAHRATAATRVPRVLLSQYERIRQRRRGTSDVVFALRGPSCGSCDTAVPLQRRTVMQRTGSIEVCEGCGALLYAAG